MRILLVKTSSLGDVIHALPAVTEAVKINPGVRFDWLVEEAFAEIPSWHPSVEQVIPVALRRWRQKPVQALRSSEWRAWRKVVRNRNYDLVLDAQGLIKSAFLARLVGKPVAGYDSSSIREPLASITYKRKVRVDRQQHAVERMRQLFAEVLGYRLQPRSPDYGVVLDAGRVHRQAGYLVWLHGSTWASKLWPEESWVRLSRLAVDAGYEVLVPWGNQQERDRAERIATHVEGVSVLPSTTLTELATVLGGAAGVVGVDGGPAHLAAAVGTPLITLYGPTDAELTGSWGPQCSNLQAEYHCSPCLKKSCSEVSFSEPQPCFSTLTADSVFTLLREKVNSSCTTDKLQSVDEGG